MTLSVSNRNFFPGENLLLRVLASSAAGMIQNRSGDVQTRFQACVLESRPEDCTPYMESDVTESSLAFNLSTWLVKHKNQVLWGAGAVVAIGFVAGFVTWRQHSRQISAGEALSRAANRSAMGEAESPEAFVKVAADYPKTMAAGSALLMAGDQYFQQGKYQEAQAQFNRYLQEFPNTSLMGQALFGVAASLDAAGRTNEAVTAYKRIVEQRSDDIVAPQAKLALARLYEAQGNLKQAYDFYEQVARADFGSLGSEARSRWGELVAKHPELLPKQPEPEPPQAESTNSLMAVTNSASSTNAPSMQPQ
jgi:tetratricopeptide (TPR) repeat protein